MSLAATKTKALARDFISHVPGVRFWVARSIFLGPHHNSHRFWGVFPTYGAAKAYIPGKYNRDFSALHAENIDEPVPERDGAVVRILGEIIEEGSRLFDLGGNVGERFYQYRSVIDYPEDFTWVVSDVALVNEAGMNLAAERGETQLAFTNDRKDAAEADIYLTNGALQYFDQPFASILRELETKPRHIIANRVPLTDSGSFYTLQHTGYSVVPYHIANAKAFVASIEALGYRMVEEWQNDRFCDILLRPDRHVSHYYGFHFEKVGR